MLSISIGPFLIAVPLFITIVGISVFWATTHWLTRKSPEKKQAVDAIFNSVWVGVVVARIAFVLTLWSEYKADWWQIFNIRDGGFIPYYGWMASVFMLIVSSGRKRKISQVYLQASIPALCVIVALKYVAFLSNTEVGLPQSSVRNSIGDKVSLQTFKGRPLVINYWATWCPPCRKEMPILQAAQHHHSDVTFLFVNQGESTSTVTEFLQAQGLELDNVFYDPASQLSRESGAAGLPTTLFFDASGKLIANRMGELSQASLAHYLQQLNANENGIQNKESKRK
ncbi:TlpA disulfide reductase family protein [Paraglaciecola sp.]|uniref:TlpA disulfide reductase family protein n=1 Tax=Paraglaciecola sp. TaxID=1920173 RepID=UPI0030F37CE3